MSVIFDYFLAASDAQAADVLTRPAGPTSGSPELHAVDGAGIEPVVVLGQLEGLLTGKSFDEVLESLGDPVAEGAGGTELVLRVSDAIGPALSALSPEQQEAVAAEWAGIEEFYGTADSGDLVDFMRRLAELAELGRNEGLNLYCWCSL